MPQSRFTDEPVVGIICEADREPVAEAVKRHPVNEQTICAWHKRFGELRTGDVLGRQQLEAEKARLKGDQVRRLKELEAENARSPI